MTEPTEKTDEYRGAKGRFLPGNPGRPPGAKHAALKLLDEIGEENAEAVMQKVCAMALGGDMRAADLLLTRLWPARKGKPVRFTLPEIKTVEDAAQAAGAVLQAVAAGELTPEEGGAVSGLLAAHREALMLREIDGRLAALEGGARHGRA